MGGVSRGQGRIRRDWCTGGRLHSVGLIGEVVGGGRLNIFDREKRMGGKESHD